LKYCAITTIYEKEYAICPNRDSAGRIRKKSQQPSKRNGPNARLELGFIKLNIESILCASVALKRVGSRVAPTEAGALLDLL